MPEVSVQGVKSLGGHFACLCLGFDFYVVKFMFSKKATKFDKIFTVDLTLCNTCQIDGEDFVNFCGLFRKHEL